MSIIRFRMKNKIYAGLIGGLIVAILSSLGYIFLINYQSKQLKMIKAEYEVELTSAQQALQEQQAISSKIVVTIGDLKAGDIISSKQLTTAFVSRQGAPTNAIADPKQLIGKVIKIDAGKGTALTPAMVYAEGATPKDLRSREYSVMELPGKLKKGDFVDVRIGFPNGSDYIVLSKKKVEDLSGTTVWYNINESELLAMSSAIVDAYLQGARLYAISYADPYMQEKAIPNYPANIDVINLIQSDPNVLEKATLQLSKEARSTLDMNLGRMSEADKAKVSGAAVSQTSSESAADAASRISNGNSGTYTQDSVVSETPALQSSPSASSTSPVTDPAAQGTDESKPSVDIVTPIEPKATPASSSSATSSSGSHTDQKAQDVFEQPLVK
ncbi:SAF domain-containing protein [Paenibacillus hunanensis]|uniref:SAF domain-containing protein n=1 Tax=Paenibacillus hunanensis TaxID=539262 RepID=UPI002A6A0814|nr:SAF domain-containing protein [Paenibacillus hunanensis]WPP42235.1 SAF domain-containing protein [Paenibacillus hunanensis]